MREKTTDYLIKNLVIQFVICSVVFLILFFIFKSNSNLFNTIKSTYSAELEKSFTSEEVKDVFSHIGGLFNVDNDTKDDDEITATIDAGGKDISAEDKKKISREVSLKEFKLNKKAFLPVKGEITSPFGYRTHPISGEYGFHCGIDIGAKEGTNIFSAFDGTVIEASYNEWNGNYIKIKHSDDIITVYCHCKKLLVKENYVIKAGERIATVGSTGSSTGPHLHFEIRINNVSYNPEYLLKDAVDEI